jgi:biotin-dependent carboxylase-like uncharacterized protein
MLSILSSGPFTTVQDLGRSGRAHQGIAHAGAADLIAHRLANRLVGNHERAASLEITLGPFSFTSDRPVVLSVTGARTSVLVTQNDSSKTRALEGQDCAMQLGAHDILQIGMCTEGLRMYLGVRGGIEVAPVLGSRSYDSLGQIGPPPLSVGDKIPIGDSTDTDAWFETVPIIPYAPIPMIRLLSGPRENWLRPEGYRTLHGSIWTVGDASDRTGQRLVGPPLHRIAGELPSEAMIVGAVQLPSNGQPIVLGPDCGTTGGYPVIAVVHPHDLSRMGQCRPGDTLRFRHVTN